GQSNDDRDGSQHAAAFSNAGANSRPRDLEDLARVLSGSRTTRPDPGRTPPDDEAERDDDRAESDVVRRRAAAAPALLRVVAAGRLLRRAAILIDARRHRLDDPRHHLVDADIDRAARTRRRQPVDPARHHAGHDGAARGGEVYRPARVAEARA